MCSESFTNETCVLLMLHSVIKVEIKTSIKLDYFFITEMQKYLHSCLAHFRASQSTDLSEVLPPPPLKKDNITVYSLACQRNQDAFKSLFTSKIRLKKQKTFLHVLIYFHTQIHKHRAGRVIWSSTLLSNVSK